MTVPRLSRPWIRAVAPGWCPAFRALGEGLPRVGTQLHLEFTLEEAYKQAGRLVDENGQPVANRTFSCLVLQRSRYDPGWGQWVAANRVQGEGISAAASESKDYTILQSRYSVRTDGMGRFALCIARKGELSLMLWDPEFQFKLEPIGDSAEPRGDIEFAVTHTRCNRWVSIKDGGEPLRQAPIVLMNYSHWPLEAAVTVWTTDRGELDFATLPAGEWFGIQRARIAKEPKVFQHGAQSELDLALLQGAVEFMNRQGR